MRCNDCDSIDVATMPHNPRCPSAHIMTDLPADLAPTPQMVAPDHTRDFADLRGMDAAINAIADGVRHSAQLIVLSGPPGVGKTALSSRIPTILPPLADHERRWLAAEYEGCGIGRTGGGVHGSSWPWFRPFRAPHHTISAAAMAGCDASVLERGEFGKPTGRKLRITRAGEVDLARFGVLFLDELDEFPKAVIDALAARLGHMAGRPLIVASTNPCPCGWRNVSRGVPVCTCSEAACIRWQVRRSQLIASLVRERVNREVPIPVATVRDRMVVIDVAPLSLAAMRDGAPGRSSGDIRRDLWGAS